MRVLVTGGRYWNLRDETFAFLDKIHEASPITVLIHGDAAGADRLCRDWALQNNIEVETYPADWDQFGRKAGPIRNQQMIDHGRPDILIAFIGGTGTNNMKKLAKRAKLPIITFDEGYENE